MASPEELAEALQGAMDLPSVQVAVSGSLTLFDAEDKVVGSARIFDPKRAARGRYGKRKGSANELRVMVVLRKKGYHCTKSSASLGSFDVIAFNAEHVLCIQVKSTSMPPPAERREMLAVALPPNAHRIIWRWRPRGTYLVTELLVGDVQVPFLLPADLPT